MAFTPLQSWQRLIVHRTAHGLFHEGGRLFWGGVKAFADGSLGSRTALMWEPYLLDTQPHAPDKEVTEQHTAVPLAHPQPVYGTRVMPLEELEALVQAADAAGLMVAIHAIGDRAVDEVVDVMRRVRIRNSPLHSDNTCAEGGNCPSGWFQGTWQFNSSEHLNGSGLTSASNGAALCEASGKSVLRLRGPRHRVEHFQHVSAPTSARLASQIGVCAAPNPLHLVLDGEMKQQRLGPVRAGVGRSFAFKTLAQAGLQMGMASDWPVADLNPLASVFVSVFRKAARNAPPDSTRAYEVEEALSVGQALLGHTALAAYVGNLEDHVGSLRPGLRADMVLLNSSPFLMRPGQPLPQVLETWLDGICMYGCSRDADS